VRFFLEAIAETAESGKRTFQKILTSRQELEYEVVKLGRRAENARRLIIYLYSNPAITVKMVSQRFGLKYDAANQLVTALVETGILKEATGYQRNRVFIFHRYLTIFEAEDQT
jgi:Fic family protein